MKEIEVKPYNTAMRRTSPSPMARFVASTYTGMSVLDYGCGRFDDKGFYEQYMSSVAGYDPHEKFGYPYVMGGQKYEIVVLNFVLNTIADIAEREIVLNHAISMATRRVIVSTRSRYEIETKAQKNLWHPYKDGYISSRIRGTFQVGMDLHDIASLTTANPIDVENLPTGIGVTYAVFKAGTNHRPASPPPRRTPPLHN